MNKKRYYFFPFLDQVLSVLVCLLFTMFFGSWFGYPLFGFLCGIIFSLVMCGFIYSRMWRLSRNNTRYKEGLDASAGVKLVLPLCIVHLILIFIYILAKHNVIPLQSMVRDVYYTFPENADRVKVTVSVFTHLKFYMNMWFAYFVPFTNDMPVWLMCFAPVLTVLSAALGFKLGAENKELTEKAAKAINATTKKFHE